MEGEVQQGSQQKGKKKPKGQGVGQEPIAQSATKPSDGNIGGTVDGSAEKRHVQPPVGASGGKEVSQTFALEHQIHRSFC